MRLIDTHVHLTSREFEQLPGSVAGVIERANAVGVDTFVIPAINTASARQAAILADEFDGVYFAVGAHPTAPDEDIAPLKKLIEHPKCVAVGEVGLDSQAGDVTTQQRRLVAYLNFANKHNKPVILHVRDYWDEAFATLFEFRKQASRTVVHCFTGTPAQTDTMAKLGMFLSVTAIVARNNTNPLTREAIRRWPLERLMLETDAPWLPWPGPPAGRYPNEPSTVLKIAQMIADIKRVSVETVAGVTTAAALEFFAIKD